MVTIERRSSDFENSFHLPLQENDKNANPDGSASFNSSVSNNTNAALTIEFRKLLEGRDGQKIALGNDELLRFLRAGGFDIDKGRIIFEKNEKYNRDNADLVAITFEMVEHVYSTEVIQVLADREEGGSKIILVNARNWNPDDVSLEYAMMAGWYLLNEMLYSEETQIKGVSVILDLSGVTMRQAARFVTHFTLKQIHRLLSFYEGGYPIKLRQIHTVNTPIIVSSTYSGFKYLLKKKIRDRIHVHYYGPKSLDKHFTKDILPVSLDGIVPNCDVIDKVLMKSLYDRYKK